MSVRQQAANAINLKFVEIKDLHNTISDELSAIDADNAGDFAEKSSQAAETHSTKIDENTASATDSFDTILAKITSEIDVLTNLVDSEDGIESLKETQNFIEANVAEINTKISEERANRDAEIEDRKIAFGEAGDFEAQLDSLPSVDSPTPYGAS
jgi:hypothetical protein